MGSDDLDKLARGLTEAQLEALLVGYAWSGHTRLALWKLKLVVSLHDGFKRDYYYESPRYLFRHTPLGLALKAHIERTTHE